MKKNHVITLAISAFIFLNIFLFSLFQTHGETFPSWELIHEKQTKSINLPYSLVLKDTGIYQFSTKFPKTDKDILVLQRVYGYAMKVYINGKKIGQEGDFKYPTTNLWNTTHVFSLDDISLNDENSLDIYLYGAHDVGLASAPYLANFSKISFILDVQNFMTSGFALLMNGTLLILAIMLFFFALKSKENKKLYLHFALADITYFIYNFEYIYRFSVMELNSFLILRKLLIIAAFFSSFFLMLGTKEYTNKDKISKPILFGFIVCISAILAAPNFYLLKIIIDISNLFLIICLIYILIIGFHASKSTLYFSCTFLMLTIIQVTLLNIFKFDMIYTLNYGMFIFFSVLSLTIVLNFSELEERVFLLNNIAKTDPLTEIRNRSALEDYIFSKSDSLMFIDLNDFKDINDSYGHDKGDEILKIVSKVLTTHVSKNDICIRYGGDEFLIIFKDLELSNARIHASLIYNNLLTNTEKISISYGVAAMNVSLAETIINADKDMYKMKAHIKQNAIYKQIID